MKKQTLHLRIGSSQCVSVVSSKINGTTYIFRGKVWNIVEIKQAGNDYIIARLEGGMVNV